MSLFPTIATPLVSVAALLTALSQPLAATVLTHGPIMGGVTASSGKVFVRTDVSAQVTIPYATDADMQNAVLSAPVTTNYQ